MDGDGAIDLTTSQPTSSVDGAVNTELVDSVVIQYVDAQPEEEATIDTIPMESLSAAEAPLATIEHLSVLRVQSPVEDVLLSESSCESHIKATKKRRAVDPLLVTSSSSDDDESGNSCAVCLEPFKNTGEHRLASLKCGHLFGQSCIKRWIMVQGSRKCPTCNKLAHKKDIRLLYAPRKLQVLDTSEMDSLKQQLETVCMEKNRIELELTTALLRCEKLQADLKALREQLVVGGRGGGNSQPVAPHIKRSITIGAACRILAYCPQLGLIVVSQKEADPFPGYGVRKVDAVCLRPTQLVHVHRDPIRDMAFQPAQPDMLLTASIDRQAKLTDMRTNSVVRSFSDDSPLWACCWDGNSPHQLLTGNQCGRVTLYDNRGAAEPLESWTTDGDRTPVVALQSLPPAPDRTLPNGGFIACRLNAVRVYEAKGSNLRPVQRLSLTGSFMSLRYDEATQQLLVSTRPDAVYFTMRHTLVQFARYNSDVITYPLFVLAGGRASSVMSRSAILPATVAAYSTDACGVELWSTQSGAKMAVLPTSQQVLDICPLRVNGVEHVAMLSETTLSISNPVYINEKNIPFR